MSITYHTAMVGNVEVFYRESGRVDAPVMLLLHGFPTASHMFRDLIPHLAGRYRVIAPDLPGFGNTKAPPGGEFNYTFANLARVVDGFIESLGLDRYALYVFDYGAPTGYRIALAHPERVTAIISQNGNAYLDGFSDAWGPWQTYWREPTAEHREACRDSLSPEVIRKWQYFNGSDPSRVSPDGYTLDIAYMARPGAEEIQLDLILDYRSNVALYPEFQAYFRKWQPPFLAAWGKNDAHFIPAGAQALSTRPSERRGASARYRALRPRNPRRGDQRSDPGIPRVHALVEKVWQPLIFRQDAPVPFRDLFRAGFAGPRFAQSYAVTTKVLESLPPKSPRAHSRRSRRRISIRPPTSSQASASEREDPDFVETDATDGIILVVLTIAKAKEATWTALRDNVPKISQGSGVKVSSAVEGLKLIGDGKEINYEGASGPCSFDEIGDETDCKFRYELVEGGKFKFVRIV